MLTSSLAARTVSLVATAIVATAGALVLTSSPASAQTWVNCPSGTPPYIDIPAKCPFGVNEPQIDSGPFQLELPGGGQQSNRCIRQNGVPSNESDEAALRARGPREIICAHPEYGQYSRAWDCYLDERNLPPAEGMHGYPEHAEDGKVYLAACFPPGSNPHGLSHWTTCFCGAQGPEAQWPGAPAIVVIPPAEALDFDEGGPGLLEVWVEAFNSLEMYGPTVTTAPPVDTAGLVHLPVWLWTEETELTWPDRLEAAAPDPPGGEWLVEVYAEPRSIQWDMGDGRDPRTCAGPGVAWEVGMDFLSPPDEACTYTYRRSSLGEPGQVFDIVAITTWYVWWDINGVFDADVEIQVGTTATYQVDEIQVLTRQ